MWQNLKGCTKGEVGAPWNLFKPFSKIFYWPFQGGTSFVDNLYYLCFLMSCFRVCSLLLCGHRKGKGWRLGSCLWRLLWFCYFPICTLGQVLYMFLNVSIPDPFLLWTLFGLNARNLVFGVCEQQRHRPVCISEQSYQLFCYSLIGMNHIKTCYGRNLNFQSSLCSWAG